MLYLQHLFSHNKQIIFGKKVINVRHNSRCGIFNRKNCIIGSSSCYFFHGIPKQLHMIAFNILLEISTHGTVAVSTFYPLENNGHIVSWKLVNHLEILFLFRTILGKKLVLAFSADCHDLLKKLLCTQLIEFSMGFFPDFFQLCIFPFRIQHLLSSADLILCNFLADLHSFLEKLYHLVINFVYFPSAFLQICHIVSSQIPVFYNSLCTLTMHYSFNCSMLHFAQYFPSSKSGSSFFARFFYCPCKLSNK